MKNANFIWGDLECKRETIREHPYSSIKELKLRNFKLEQKQFQQKCVFIIDNKQWEKKHQNEHFFFGDANPFLNILFTKVKYQIGFF